MPQRLATIKERGTGFHIVKYSWPVVASVIGLVFARFFPEGWQWGALLHNSWQHFLVELLCVGIALSVFLVGWYAGTRQTLRGLVLSVAFLAAGSLNLLFMLSLPGMPDFVTPNTLHKALIFGHASRLVVAGCIYGVTRLPVGRIKPSMPWCFLCGVVLGMALFTFFILKYGTSPLLTYPEGSPVSWACTIVGATTICLLLGAYQRIPLVLGKSPNPIYIYSKNSIGTLIVGEMAFGLSHQAGDIYGFIGYTYKAIAYCYIFQCLLISSPRRFRSRQIRLRKKLSKTRRLRILGRQMPRLAHELKNPLSAIRASAQLSTMLDDPVQRNQVAKRMESEVDRLTELISVALESTWSRWEARWEIVNTQGLIHEVVALWMPELTRAGIITELHIEEELPPIQAHGGLLQQALANMVLNAIEAMPNGGELWIGASHPPGRFIVITIADTGMGIPIEVRNRIFDEFVTTKQRGTGLGLAITYQIITELHRGKIWFETAVGMGTKFIVRLPIN